MGITTLMDIMGLMTDIITETTITGILEIMLIEAMALGILQDRILDHILVIQGNPTIQKVLNQLQEIRLRNQEVIQGLQTQSLELLQSQLTRHRDQLQGRRTLSLDLVRDLRTHSQNLQQGLLIKNLEVLLQVQILARTTEVIQVVQVAEVPLEAAEVDHQVAVQKNQDNHEKYFINYQHIIVACFRFKSKQCRCTSL
jgi:hypothetical protein